MKPKFRAWEKESKEMIEVSNIHFEEGIVNYSTEQNSLPWRFISEVVLMQSTGFNDKNNKEIFEGDLIHFGNDKTYLVYKSITNPELRIWTSAFGDESLYYHMAKSCEVVGNRYETPERMPEALKKVKEMEDEE